MPMERSASTRAKEKNFEEFRHGKTFKKTAAKFGKKKAEKQMVAAVLSNQRKFKKKGVGAKKRGKATSAKKNAKKALKRYRK